MELANQTGKETILFPKPLRGASICETDMEKGGVRILTDNTAGGDEWKTI